MTNSNQASPSKQVTAKTQIHLIKYLRYTPRAASGFQQLQQVPWQGGPVLAMAGLGHLGRDPGTPWSTRGASRRTSDTFKSLHASFVGARRPTILSMQKCLPAKASGSPAHRAD